MTFRTLALLVALASSCTSGCAALPDGAPGPDADALAHRIEAAVNRDGWEKTGAVSFRFRQTRSFLWDRSRSMVLMDNGDVRVLLDLWDRRGTATKKGAPLAGAELDAALADAWKFFCNDTFWLNPLVKLFDDGVTRELVDAHTLKVTYGSGGVTPGDSYVWHVDDGGTPLSVRMWVSVLPVKGVEFGWTDWVTLSTGAKVARTHPGPAGQSVDLQDVLGAATLPELLAQLHVEDPFGPLVDRRASRAR
jgi:hypothetical protein